VLNLRWIGQTFWRSFKGRATTFTSWFRLEVAGTLRKQTPAILLTISIGMLASIAGYAWLSANVQNVPSEASTGHISSILASGLGAPEGTDVALSFPLIWGHNIQAIAIILFFGIFSFGILGAVVYLLNMGIIGAALALVNALGHSPVTVGLAGILPHGIFEIPALILASAAILYIGAVLVTPRSQRTLGEVLIDALADWMKIGLGVVFPLLTIAAVIETWVTPVLLSSVLK
jgi:stage II sporulation protein M